MKKIWIVLAAAVMVLALGTAVYATTDKDTGGFKQMLPHMKQMHPDVSEQQLEEMYNNCNSNEKGMSGMHNMMNGSKHNMMNKPEAAVQ